MFKKGDIVVGLPKNGYRITGGGCVCEVIEMIDKGRMTIKLIKTGNPYVKEEEQTDYSNSLFKVRCHGFVLESGRTNQSVIGLLRKGDVF